MTNIVTYRYTSIDLLSERYHYQYTPYEGPDFLVAYLAQRRKLCSQLSAARRRLLSESSTDATLAEEIREAVLGDSVRVGLAPLQVRHLEVLPAQPNETDFVTESLLLDLWQCYIHDAEHAWQICPAWANLLLAKYEVTKRLYVKYTFDLKPAKAEYDVLSNYALLATLLMYQYKSVPNLKHLNTVLKLTDLLSSTAPLEGSALTQLASLVALEAELSAVQGLMEDHGVVL